jgi:hypothetical protein
MRVTTIVLATTPLDPHGSLQAPLGTHALMQSSTTAISYGGSIVAVEPMNDIVLVETTTSAPELIEDSTNATHVLDSDSGTAIWKDTMTLRVQMQPHTQWIIASAKSSGAKSFRRISRAWR